MLFHNFFAVADKIASRSAETQSPLRNPERVYQSSTLLHKRNGGFLRRLGRNIFRR